MLVLDLIPSFGIIPTQPHGKQNVKSKIAYATDTWTMKQMVHTFACTIGCFIDEDWRLVEHVLDFKVLEDKDHEGLYAGRAFVDGLRKRGGLNKISLQLRTHIHFFMLIIPVTALY
jgi:hypothetical protein